MGGSQSRRSRKKTVEQEHATSESNTLKIHFPNTQWPLCRLWSPENVPEHKSALSDQTWQNREEEINMFSFVKALRQEDKRIITIMMLPPPSVTSHFLSNSISPWNHLCLAPPPPPHSVHYIHSSYIHLCLHLFLCSAGGRCLTASQGHAVIVETAWDTKHKYEMLLEYVKKKSCIFFFLFVSCWACSLFCVLSTPALYTNPEITVSQMISLVNIVNIHGNTTVKSPSGN